MARHPLIGVSVLLAVLGAFLPGLFKLQITNDQNDLWVNKEGDLYKEQKVSDDNFGAFFRAEQVIFRSRDGVDKDLIQTQYLEEVFWFQEIAKRTKVSLGGKTYTIKDLCWSALPDADCTIQTPLGFWQSNLTRLLQDKDPHWTTQCLASVDPNNTMACMDETGLPVQTNVVFGGISKIYNRTEGCRENENGEIVRDDGSSDPCTPYVYNANALVLTFLLNQDDRTNQISSDWEKRAIMDTASLWKNNKGTSFIRNLLPDYTIPDRPLQLDMSYMVGRSISDELQAESEQNSFIVIVSYGLMLIYVTFSLGHIPSKKGKPTFLIGVIGIVIVAISVLVGYGATSYLGVKSSMISLEVIPFLILAIGVDNMFIIAQAVGRETHKKPEVRIGLAFHECFPSIAVACITEVVTFAVGISTNIPALKVFCMTAVFAILANFVLQTTAFLACLSWDMKRVKGVDDAYAEAGEQKSSFVSGFFSKVFTPIVQSRVTNAVVLVVALGLIVVSPFAFSKLRLGIDQQITVRTDGILYNYFNDLANYFNSGPQAYIIMENFQSDDTSNQFMQNVTNLLVQKKDLITPPFQNWLSDFNRFLQNIDQNCQPKDSSNVSQSLTEFIAIPYHDYCCQRNGICGNQYYQHIRPMTDPNSTVVPISRIMFLHSPVRTQEDFIRNYDETHQMIASLQKNLTDMAAANDAYDDQPKPTMFANSMFYIYFEQYTYIKGVAVQNLLISLFLLFAIVAAVFSVIIAIHLTVIIVFLVLSMITMVWISNFCFSGFGIMINAVSVVNLVTAIGFAVEFSVHTLLKYERTVGTKAFRIKTALNTMGASVFSGIFLTKLLGISILAFAPSALFRLYYFRMYVLMIVLCGFYGLVFLPAYLAVVGSQKLPGTKADPIDNDAGSVSQSSMLNPFTVNVTHDTTNKQ